jgi:hypothetical protein
MAIFYTSTRSPKRKPGIKQLRSKEEHLAYLKSLGYTPGMRIEKTAELPKYEYRRVTSEESAATIKEIERKKTCLAPAYNKGAVQYVTAGTDPRYIGKKV